jgi:hypothetical protein
MVLLTSSLCQFSSAVANHRPLTAAWQNSPAKLAKLYPHLCTHTTVVPLRCAPHPLPINLRVALALDTWRACSPQSQACGHGFLWIPSGRLGARVRSSIYVSSRGCKHHPLPCPHASSWWIHGRQVPPFSLHAVLSLMRTQRLHVSTKVIIGNGKRTRLYSWIHG